MTTFIIGATCLNLVLTTLVALAFRRIHQNQGRKDLSSELFRQYRDDPNGLKSWLCKGAIIQIKSENSFSETDEIRNLRQRVLAPMR